MKILDRLVFSDKGLIPAVIQDESTSEVLTLCYMNREALEKSFEEGKIYVYRRSKGRLMLKGETSGCVQLVRGVYVDCEGKSILFKVDQNRAACHEGYFSCYFRKINDKGELETVAERVFDPKSVYGK